MSITFCSYKMITMYGQSSRKVRNRAIQDRRLCPTRSQAPCAQSKNWRAKRPLVRMAARPFAGRASARPPQESARPSTHPTESLQLDLAFDLVAEADATDRDGGAGGERLVALDAALRQRLAHRLLDLALCAYAQRL